MSLNDSILDLATNGGSSDQPPLTIQRTADGAYVDGVYQQGTTTTFTIDAVVQPAFNLNRVIGGSNLDARVDGQSTTEVRQLHTPTLLLTRDSGHDPDVILGLDGGNWTVARVEKWDNEGEIHYHCVITRQTGGAA